MTELTFEIINSENTNKFIHNLSDIDIQNLKNYVNQHNQPLINQTDVENTDEENTDAENTDAENTSIDLYLNRILTKDAQPHDLHTEQANDQPIASLSSDTYNKFSLEIATCGMQKNTQLPVPYENFSLTDGCFGDDVGFVVQKGEENFLGISDGVSGNLMYGHNPRLFSESLMRNCSDLVHTGKYSISDPKRLLCDAFDCVQNENCFGSATVCILGIDCRSSRLYSVNIGDSGYVIVRQGSVIYRSESQEMNGDAPRQLAVYPWISSLKQLGLNYTQISSFDAICQTFDLELNDIIILSTDGLFDNVPDYIIEQILSKNHSLKYAAHELVNRAVRCYVKPDDILVLMARITTHNQSI